jgi:hypothetical protein
LADRERVLLLADAAAASRGVFLRAGDDVRHELDRAHLLTGALATAAARRLPALTTAAALLGACAAEAGAAATAWRCSAARAAAAANGSRARACSAVVRIVAAAKRGEQQDTGDKAHR